MNLVEHAARELTSNGFVVLKGFASPSDIPREVVEFVRSAKPNIDGAIWPLPRFPQAAKLEQSLHQMIGDVAARLGISASSRGTTSAIRVTEGKGGLGWHLDHGTYYYTHNAVDHLICYVPVFKPSIAAANVAILPYAVLRRADPATYDRLKGRGAVELAKVNDEPTLARARKRVIDPRSLAIGDWVVFDNYHYGRHSFKLNLDPEEHRVVPQLDVGDFLMFRADVLHRTEDTKTERIALRFDAFPSHPLDRWSRLYKLLSTRSAPAIVMHRIAQLRHLHSW
ncbi:MAG: hypothetical protein H7138_19955 [Myxococcales bacterium]|nr:hypothetical protein [Myxococcales bacterium]